MKIMIIYSEHVIAIRAGKQRAVSSATVARMNSQDSNISIFEVVSDKTSYQKD